MLYVFYVSIILMMFKLTSPLPQLQTKRVCHSVGSRLFLTTNILLVGKKNSVESWISTGIEEYEKRLRPIMNVNTFYFKNDEDLVEAALSQKGYVIALDEHGKHYTSRQFTEVFYRGLEEGGAQLSFIVGGFDGLPDKIKIKYPLISLSNLTWTHQMARLLLIEQIYRATEIRKNSKYHKD